MYIYCLIIIHFATFTFSAERTICRASDSTCTDSTLFWAASHGSAGDTLTQVSDTIYAPGRSGYNDFMRNRQFFHKGLSQGVYCITTGFDEGIKLRNSGDSIRLDGIKIITQTGSSTDAYMINSTGYSGFRFNNLTFDRNGNNSAFGIRMQQSVGVPVYPSHFRNVYSNVPFPRYDGSDILREMNFVNCYWSNAPSSFGHKSTIDSSYMSTNGEFVLFGDSLTIKNSTVDGFNANYTETITTDDESIVSQVINYKIINTVHKGCKHIAICIDGWINSSIFFVNIGPDTTALFYNHGSDTADVIESLNIKNITITVNNNVFICAGTHNTHNTINFDKCYLISTYDNIKSTPISLTGSNHSAQHIYSNRTLSLSGFSSISDTGSNIAAKTVLIDSLRYRFLKQNVTSNILILDTANNLPIDWIGMYGYLTNHNGIPSDITDSSYTISDSIAHNYWYEKGPNYPCSLITVLWDSIAGIEWSPCDTDTVKANEKFNLVATGKSANTTYYYRSISTPIGEANKQFIDTTKIFSVTTLEAAISECDSITNLGASDSTATSITAIGRLDCISDSAWIKFVNDTNTITDSTFIYIADVSIGDTIRYTKNDLQPSTRYWFQWRDSTNLSLWLSAFTADSVSDTIYDTIPQ